MNYNSAKKIISEIASSLISKEELVLVGGQSIEFWRHYYGLETRLDYLTRDIDFYGGTQSAEENFCAFAHKNQAELFVPDLDDASPNSAKITFFEGNEKVEIDYLYQVTGLSDDDIESYSPIVTIDNHSIKVLYPILCMESKISNLAVYPAKRRPEGIEQARLAIEISRAYITELIDNKMTKDTFELIERIARFSKRESSKFAFYHFGMDTFHAIPIEKYPDDNFKSLRYPQLIAEINSSRAKFAVLMDARKELYDIELMRYRL